MFNDHQRVIGGYARSGPDEMARVYAFVLATVQQRLWQTPEIMYSIDNEGIESRFLWGFKGPAYEYLCDNKEEIYETAMAINRNFASPASRSYELLYYFAGLPGLGIVKGGFLVQLCFGMAGCIDSHNMALFGIAPSRFKASVFKAAKRKKRRRMLHDYLAVIAAKGGCEVMWDRWCIHVHKLNTERYESAHAVSKLHVTAIGAT